MFATMTGMLRAKLLAFAQLLRLPNLFTAVADPLAGWLLTGGGPAAELSFRVGASACLYTAGLVLNDCFDYQLDCRERPERPLPRGTIARGTAWALAGVLLVVGLGLAAWAGTGKFLLALGLVALIFLYNAGGKNFAVVGACRSANFLLGMTGVTPWWAPVTLGMYVAGLTVIARREVVNPALRQVVKQMLLGIIVVDAGFVALAGDWGGAALVLSLLVPAMALGKILLMT